MIVSIALLLIFALVFLFKMISKPIKEKFSGVKGNVVCANKKEIVATANILSTGDLLMHEPVFKAFYDENTKSYNFEKIFTYLSFSL